MAKNEFLKDSFRFFQKFSRNITEDNLEEDFSIIQTTLLFAIGVEKLLKGIIYDINPLYIL